MADEAERKSYVEAAKSGAIPVGMAGTEAGVPDTGLPADAGGVVSTPEDASMLRGVDPAGDPGIRPGAAGDMSGGSSEKQDRSGTPPAG
jgi:hypothetical protein